MLFGRIVQPAHCGVGGRGWGVSIAAPQARLFPVLALSCLVAPFLAGCQPTPTLAQETSPLSQTRRGATTGNAKRHPAAPQYQRALQQFQQGDAQGALHSVEAILDDPTLTPPQREFLQRQRDIFNQALHPAAPGKASSQTQAATPPMPPSPAPDCGPRALALALQQTGIRASSQQIARLAGTDKEGTSLEGLARAARRFGVPARGVQMDGDALERLECPALAWIDGNHFAAILERKRTWLGGLAGQTRFIVRDPNQETSQAWNREQLLSRSGGVLLLLSPTNDVATTPAPAATGTKPREVAPQGQERAGR